MTHVARYSNLTSSECLAAQAEVSTTTEALPAEHVVQQQQANASRQRFANDCSAEWNAVHAAVGSFADEHSTL
jgi:antitoxin CcdA